MSRRATAIAVALVVIGVANHFAAFAGAVMLGGDALNGKVENGRYYVGDHGKYKEVTRGEWQFNAFHTATIFITGPIMVVAIIFLAITRLQKDERTEGRKARQALNRKSLDTVANGITTDL